mgnify:FL=1
MNLTCLAAAPLFELLSMGLRLPDKQLAETLASGEYADALQETLSSLGIVDDGFSDSLHAYVGQDAEALFHRARAEYTRLFVGAPHALVSPYAGVYYAEKVGVTPVLYVNKESMEVERFMAACGMGRPRGTNEPLDHIASELEFLEYLALDAIGAMHDEERQPVPDGSLEKFYADKFAPFAQQLAPKIAEASEEALYMTLARVLQTVTE